MVFLPNGIGTASVISRGVRFLFAKLSAKTKQLRRNLSVGETTITAQGIVLALFFLFLGALLGDVLPDWRVKAVSIAVCSGLLIFLIEFFVGLTARLAAVLPHYEWVPPVLIGGVVLSLALPFLKPHSRFQMFISSLWYPRFLPDKW
ncbi:MAG TPA: hypothetical protein VGZ23_15605 [bacterium]|nr:hypothetical protein [bacterium]